MPINKAVLAAFIKAATRLRPDIKKSYKAQRVVEDLSGKLRLPDPRCRIEDHSATMPDGYEVPLRVFTPLDISFTLASGLEVTEDSRGTILFFHGGGWVNGSVDFYIEACTTMAIKLERRVIAVDYRRAPEHRFPQAPEDCYEVARQLFAGTLISDVEINNCVLAGDSAGGNLAAVVSLMARDRGAFKPRTQILLYPATYNDHSPASRFESVRTNGYDYLLTAQDVADYMELYIRSPEDLTNPYFAPLLASDLSNQPRTLLVSAEYCPLRDEGEAFAQRLSQAGNDVQCYRIIDAIHGYFLYPAVFSLVKDTYALFKHFLDGDALEKENGQAWLEISGTD
ncbi:MAG: alpha/beta hydrolase [Coriobacteriales bacterium]|jgi:acetyl esterase/lipase|nr:alpha/beta hydrolase [Coriobacteriales bacterium]